MTGADASCAQPRSASSRYNSISRDFSERLPVVTCTAGISLIIIVICCCSAGIWLIHDGQQLRLVGPVLEDRDDLDDGLLGLLLGELRGLHCKERVCCWRKFCAANVAAQAGPEPRQQADARSAQADGCVLMALMDTVWVYFGPTVFGSIFGHTTNYVYIVTSKRSG